MRRRPSALAFLGALAVLAAACGGGGDDAGVAGLAASDPGPIHVHGLGVDPRDETLFIATHTGLWRLPADADKAVRVGDSFQDTMGFTVAAPGRFLGSGHPDLRQAREDGLPPHLGLIESTDGGETWEPRALLGEADFHVLRVGGDSGEFVYGFDATNARLLASSDGGATWEERATPGFLVDLVPDPTDPGHLVASTEEELVESGDGGRTWSALSDGVGLLAWPAADRLFLAVPGGLVFRSEDGGRTWVQAGDAGGEPAALLATSAEDLYAALHDGTIVRSADGGITWSVRSRP
jgi:hypothetical protein